MSVNIKTIKELMEEIQVNDITLPTIQRGFVWLKNKKEQKVEKLFDSLMCQYPIGQIVVWKNNENKNHIKFYKFLSSYDFRNDINENEKLSANTRYLVLDGQQRLTALYLSLTGKLIDKGGNDLYMYLNLFYKKDKETVDEVEHQFKFLKEEDAEKINENELWFKLELILTKTEDDLENFKESYITELLEANPEKKELLEGKENNKNIKTLIGQVWNNIREKEINCELVKNNSNLLEVFVRLNSGGVKLEKADLLLSFMESQDNFYDKNSARNEVISLLKKLNKRGGEKEKLICLKKDDILKACLVLTDELEVRYSIPNFNTDTVKKISNNWKNIKSALETVLNLMDAYSIDNKSLSSKNALLPIALFLIKNNLLGDSFITSDEKKHIEIQNNIINWICLVLLKKVFGASSDGTLQKMKNNIVKNKLVLPEYQGREIDSEGIKDILNKAVYGGRDTQLLLKLISPKNKWKYEQDHIFPKSSFTKDNNLNENFKNSISNLQMLSRHQNAAKNDSPPFEWMNKQSSDFKKENCIPENIELKPENFEKFINARKKILQKKLEDILIRKIN